MFQMNHITSVHIVMVKPCGIASRCRGVNSGGRLATLELYEDLFEGQNEIVNLTDSSCVYVCLFCFL